MVWVGDVCVLELLYGGFGWVVVFCGLGDCRPRLSLVLRASAVGSDCIRMVW